MSRPSWLIMSVIGAFGAVVYAGWYWSGLRAADQELRQAIALVNQERYEQAWPLLKARAESHVGQPAFELAFGRCALGVGRFDEALAAWGRIPKDSAQAREAAAARLAVARRDGRYSAAVGVTLADLPTELPASNQAQDDLLYFLRIFGQLDEAGAVLRKTWARSGDPVGKLQSLWSLERMAYPVHGVRQSLELASKQAPADVGIELAAAHLSIRLGQYDEAKRHLNSCARVFPNEPFVWRLKLDLALIGDDPSDVANALTYLDRSRLSIAKLLEIEAWCARHLGQPHAELAAWTALLDLEPGHAGALARSAELLASEGRNDEAVVLRNLKAARDGAEREYEKLLFSDAPLDSAQRLAEVADAMRCRFESKAWWTLVARRQPGDARAMAAMAQPERDASTDRLEQDRLRRTILQLARSLAMAKQSIAASAPASTELVIPQFNDSARHAGLDFRFDNGDSPDHQIPETMSGGVGLIDFDGDGWLDVYVVQGGPFPPLATAKCADRLYRNRGDGTFEDVTERAGIASFAGGYGNGVTVGDVNNDGHADLFITRWRQYALYLNRGDGTFVDATEAWDLGLQRGWPSSAALADFDNDGDLDLYVCHYAHWDALNPVLCKGNQGKPTYCPPITLTSERDHLFRNDGDRFVDVSDESGISVADRDGRGLGVVAADLDGDGKVDLFVANDTTANMLFRNLGGWRFEECALAAGVASNAEGGYLAGMGVACGDLDGDGLLDLAVTNYYGECTTFYRNLGSGLFADHTAAIGLSGPTRYRLGFGIAFADMNNDGILDIVQANGHVEDYEHAFPYAMPAQLFLGKGRGVIADVSTLAGPPWQVNRFGRALAVGDLDNDGWLDVLVVDLRGPLAYVHNQGIGVADAKADHSRGANHSNSGYVVLEARGVRSNRDAVGAEVWVEAGSVRRRAYRFGGGSYQSAGDPRLHVGLGQAERIERITISWPSGAKSVYENLKVNSGYRLIEGEELAAPLPGYAATLEAGRPR